MPRFESSSHLLQKIDGLTAQVRRREHYRSPLPDRPALLIALAELFVSRAEPTGEEIARFEDMALRMLGDADASALASVAAQLARHPNSPATLIDALLAKGGVAASILLEHCPRIGEDRLMLAAREGSEEEACGAARRPDLSGNVLEALAKRREASVLRALAAHRAALQDDKILTRLTQAAKTDSELAAVVLAADASAQRLTPLFLQAPAHLRRKMIESAEELSFKASDIHRTRLSNPTLNTWLIARARKAQWGQVAREICTLTKLPHEHAAQMIADERGEGLAVLLAAIGMPREQAVLMFLACPPAISHSCERVFALAEIMDRLPAFAALHLAEQCMAQDAGHVEHATRKPQHVTSYDAAASEFGVRGAAMAPRAVLRPADIRTTSVRRAS